MGDYIELSNTDIESSREFLRKFVGLLRVTRCSARLFIVMSLMVLSFDLNNLLNYPVKQGQKTWGWGKLAPTAPWTVALE